MTLQQAVQRYLAPAGEYGKVVPRSVFGMPKKNPKKCWEHATRTTTSAATSTGATIPAKATTSTASRKPTSP
jgi:hypothetical protein